MPLRIPQDEPRTLEQLREHYLIEKQLADRLRASSREQRRHLYTDLYDDLYERVPLHPQLRRKADSKAQATAVSEKMRLLRPFLRPGSTFLEAGPGDCALSLEAAKFVKKVYAVDVSERITEGFTAPSNFELIISDGCSIPVPDKTVNVAYSNQLIEHLHPDDALEQLRNIYDALTSGGVYICVTPNRLFGPHDISKYFDEVAKGFHLKEYTITELAKMFRAVGFAKVQALIVVGGVYRLVPVFPLLWIEAVLAGLPRSFNKPMLHRAPFRTLLEIRLVATK